MSWKVEYLPEAEKDLHFALIKLLAWVYMKIVPRQFLFFLSSISFYTQNGANNRSIEQSSTLLKKAGTFESKWIL